MQLCGCTYIRRTNNHFFALQFALQIRKNPKLPMFTGRNVNLRSLKNEIFYEKNEFVPKKNEFVPKQNEIVPKKNESFTKKNRIVTKKNEFVTKQNEVVLKQNELFT